MLFLIEYDRQRGEIVNLVAFADTEREQADDARLALRPMPMQTLDVHHFELYGFESPRLLRRPFRLSHAAMA